MLRELANVGLIVILILAATFMLGRLLSLPTPPLRLFRGDYAGAPIGDPVGPLHRPSIGYVIRQHSAPDQPARLSPRLRRSRKRPDMGD